MNAVFFVETSPRKAPSFYLIHLNFQRFTNLVLVLCVTIFYQGNLILECMVVEKSVEYPEGIFRLLL
jgi:hypothetical protein